MTEKAAENPTGNPAGKAIDFQALITEAEKNGYKVSHHFEKKPFVDWETTPSLSGLVTSVKAIPSKFGGDQVVCAVGDYMVNCSGMLTDLPKLAGQDITVICTGKEQSGTGNEYRTFTVLVKQT